MADVPILSQAGTIPEAGNPSNDRQWERTVVFATTRIPPACTLVRETWQKKTLTWYKLPQQQWDATLILGAVKPSIHTFADRFHGCVLPGASVRYKETDKRTSVCSLGRFHWIDYRGAVLNTLQRTESLRNKRKLICGPSNLVVGHLKNPSNCRDTAVFVRCSLKQIATTTYL